MVFHAFDPSTRGAEEGRTPGSRPAWSTGGVLGEPRIQRETLSQIKLMMMMIIIISLRINLTIEVKDLYSENFKPVKKEIKTLNIKISHAINN